MSVCVLTCSDQLWHFQWSMFLHADVFLSPWLCLFCSSLTVHSLLLAASSKHCSSIYTPTEETLHSAKLCRDFAKGLFLEFVGNMMQDFLFLAAMRSFPFLCSGVAAYSPPVPSNFGSTFYWAKQRKQRGRPAFCLPAAHLPSIIHWV